MVFNYLHVCHDSRYKSSIDNGPIYSIIDPTNAQMGKSNAGYPLFRELPDDARQQAARRGILPEQPAEGRYMGRLLSRAGGGRYRAGLCWKPVRGRGKRQREWYRRELWIDSRSLSLG